MNMTGSDKPSGATSSLTAFFETRATAEQARRAVVAAGVSYEAVKITDARGTATGNAAAAAQESRGLIDTIEHAFAQDQHTDGEVQGRRGFVVTAHVPELLSGPVRDIFSREGAINEDQQRRC